MTTKCIAIRSGNHYKFSEIAQNAVIYWQDSNLENSEMSVHDQTSKLGTSPIFPCQLFYFIFQFYFLSCAQNLSQSCNQAMEELICRLQIMEKEANDLENKMEEFHLGFKEQVNSILSHPPPRSLYSKNSSPTQAKSLGQEQTSLMASRSQNFPAVSSIIHDPPSPFPPSRENQSLVLQTPQEMHEKAQEDEPLIRL